MSPSQSTFDLKIQKEAFARVIQGQDLVDISAANRLADDLKSWAKSRGVTHFSYWIHPFFGKYQKELEISRLTGLSLSKKKIKLPPFLGFEEASFLAFDPTSSPFIYQEHLWIPSLVFSEKGHARDFKIPLLRSLEKLKHLQKSSPQIKISQKFYLVDEELVEKCPDLRQVGKRVYGASRIPEEGKFSQSFLKDVMKEARFLGVDVTIKKCDAEHPQYEMIFPKKEESSAIDQSLLFMEVMEEIGRKQKTVPLFANSCLDVEWFPFDIEKRDPLVFIVALIHAMHVHEDLLYTFCNQKSLFSDLRDELLSQILEVLDPSFKNKPLSFSDEFLFRGFSSLSHAALGLCAIQAALADSLELILDEIGDNPSKRMGVLKKHIQESVKEKEKTRTFSQIYAPFSDQKTVRCFSSVLNSQELDDFHKIHLDRYVKGMQEEMALMIVLFREEILPLHNKSQGASLEAKEAIFAVDDLDLFREKISDLGIEAQGKAISEIGASKMQFVRDLVNRLFLDF